MNVHYLNILLIVIIVLVLYVRTWKYHLLIDDPVPRDGYLYQGPQKVHYKFYDRHRPIMATVTNIGVFLAVCGYVYVLWGFKAALLYAVLPLNVSLVAWNTGNYYMSTVLLVLAGHKLLIDGFGFLGAFFYAAALNSTTNALSYMFIAPFFSPQWPVMLVPFLTFLFGKRLRTGLALRKKSHENIYIESKFEFKNLVNVPKIVAYYICVSLWPSRLGFFHSYGDHESFYTKRTLILSCVLCLLFFIWGCSVDPLMTMWWFLSVLVFTHIQGHYGQFISERYLALANVAFVVLIGQYVTNTHICAVLATFWFAKSWVYVKFWQNNEVLFSNSGRVFPDCPHNLLNLSSFYLERGRWRSAINPLKYALQHLKGNPKGIHMNLGACYERMYRYDEAIDSFEKALETCEKDKKTELRLKILELKAKAKRTSRIRKQMEGVYQ